MEEIKISVIIPIFNTPIDKFEVCLQSVLTQSYPNFEVVIVDDGSQEEFAKAYDDLQKTDGRIRLFHKKNEGVSVARNFGVEKSEGEYVMFVDSDDILSGYALQEGIKILEQETNVDFVFAGIKHIKSYDEFSSFSETTFSGTILYSAEDIDLLKDAFLSQKNADFNNINGTGGFVNRGPIARIIRRSIAREVLFDKSLAIGEDVEWNLRLLSKCSRMVFVKSVWYGYLVYNTSSLHKYYGNREERLRLYQQKLYENNKEFCLSHASAYYKNLSINFYTILQYDLLSEQCKLSLSEKNKLVKKYLSIEPWKKLTEKAVLNVIGKRYKLLILLSQKGLGISFLRLWRMIKLPG